MKEQVIEDRKWRYEQDYFEDTYSGYRYVIKRMDYLGHLCGYVKIKSKRLERDNDDYTLLERDIDVHGGVTYLSRLQGENGCWIGFDCAHAGDVVPVNEEVYGVFRDTSEYRDLRYVRKECKRMIKQLKEMERGK